MKLKYLNIIFAILLIVVSCVFFFYADTFRILPGQTDIGPKAFPKSVCVCLIVMGILLIISEIRKNDDKVIELFNWKFFAGLATAILYVVFFKSAGFVVCSIVAIFIMELLLLNEPFKKAWPLMTTIAVVMPVAIQLIFGSFLNVPLPTGILSIVF